MKSNATIQLNGAPHEVILPLTVSGLLASLGMEGKPVVVELDRVALFSRNFAHTPIHDGARVEIVTLAAGG